MVQVATSKLYVLRRRTPKKKEYITYFLYLPSKLINDSTFPFTEGERVRIKIVGHDLFVEKLTKPRKRRKK